MTSLASLATELLIQIIDYISPLGEFAPESEFPTLKNLSLTCHRLHSICFHPLFTSLRLHLHHGTSPNTINRLWTFIRTHQLQPTISHVTVTFAHEWNSSKNGIELKKLLWEIRAKSLTLKQNRPDTSIREKSARWSYNLNTIEALRLSLIDDDNALKMLILRVCPAKLLVVEDGCFKEQYESGAYFHNNLTQRPGIANIKPNIFPKLAKVMYSAAWPRYHRFDYFLEFVCRLPVLRELGITLMNGEDGKLNLEKEGYRCSADSVRYREIIAAYSILKRRVDGMESLRIVRVGDLRVPWRREVEGPIGWREDTGGVWRKVDVVEKIVENHVEVAVV